MPLRLVVGIAAGVALAAFFAGAVRLGAGEAPPAAAAAAAAEPVPARAPAPLGPPSTGLDPVLAARRERIAAGVLARAAKLRAQEREATCAPCAAAQRQAPGGAPAAAVAGGVAVESIEIDWNAGTPAQAQ
jgi:hypothetical protein